MLLYSEEENEEFEDMLNSMRDVLVSTGNPYFYNRPSKSKQTTIITQQQKNITEYTSPYHGFNLLLIVLHKNDTKPLFSSHIDQLTTNGSLWINKNQIL